MKVPYYLPGGGVRTYPNPQNAIKRPPGNTLRRVFFKSHLGLPQSLHLRKKRGQLALPEYTHTQAGKKKQLESFITQKNSMDGITIPSEHWRN